MPGFQRQARLPFGPLEEWARRQGRGDDLADDDISRILGVSRTAVFRWRVDGIPERNADVVVTALYLHPAVLWPTEYEQLAGPLEESA